MSELEGWRQMVSISVRLLLPRREGRGWYGNMVRVKSTSRQSYSRWNSERTTILHLRKFIEHFPMIDNCSIHYCKGNKDRNSWCRRMDWSCKDSWVRCRNPPATGQSGLPRIRSLRLPVSDRPVLRNDFCNTWAFLCNRCRRCRSASTPIYLWALLDRNLLSLNEKNSRTM